MKKTLLILVAIVFVVTACNKNTYVDGNYTATFDETDSRGWRAFVSFTLNDDIISEVDFDEIHTDGRLKSTDTEYQENMAANENTVTDPSIFIPAIESAIANTAIVPEYETIDGVTGATSSSGYANILMEAALDAAVDGEPTDLEIPRPE